MGVPTTPLVQLDVIYKPASGVRGAIVKVSPTLRASERDGFDGAKLAAELREAGARAVQLAPVIIPETSAPRAQSQVARVTSPAEVVRTYFEELRGVPEEDKRAAVELAVQLVEEAQGRGS